MISTRRLYNGLDPVRQLAEQKCDLVVNLSASPWHYGKGGVREELVVTAAARALGCPVVYCNAVGGNDELIFDGRSVVAAPTGEVVAGLAAFREELRVISLGEALQAADHRAAIADTYAQPDLPDIFDALVLGLRDYAHKSGFQKGLVALSGGIDSAVVGVLAAAALGPENVTGVSLPSAISSVHSRDDARQLAMNLGIAFQTIPIADAVAATESALGPAFAGRRRDVTEENIQARIRGVLMMALSNKFNSLLLTTGNKSEMAVGYCTLYGDMAGGLAVISDVFKTQVYALARWVNDHARSTGRPPPIPQSSIDKPPSAELRPGQVDQDSLPPYDLLDRILEAYVERDQGREEMIAAGMPAATVDDVIALVDRSEYKRRQAAPGIRITPRAFGKDRRLPITNRFGG